jgi:hypothetical protein
MSTSYAKRTKDICAKEGITLLDQSTLKEYRVTLIAPKECMLLFVEREEYTHVQKRSKGDRKESFWYQVFCTAEGGATLTKDWDHVNRIWEQSDPNRNPDSTRDSFVKGWLGLYPPPPAFDTTQEKD